MDLIDKGITHKVFGEGNIIAQDESFITIKFDKDTKKFVYPDAFGSYITLKDEGINNSFKKILIQKKKEKEELEKKQEEERKRLAEEAYRKEKLKNMKIHDSSQIVFWLDEEEKESIFTDWKVFTGEVQSGKNKGQPNKVARLRPNSAALLSERTPDQPETERKILGLYMVSETFSGNLIDDGMVTSHDEFKIELTEQESEELLFWNYYINKNYPHRTTWNSGKYRYFDNIITAQVLKDIISIRKDEDKIKEAKDFLVYFCEMNLLDIESIPDPEGALKQEENE